MVRVCVDDEGYPEIARCTEREFATILAGISAGGMYCPECGTVHWPDGVIIHILMAEGGQV
ncbi:hypothetical protein [Escherichia coli]|uniref:hypothetical protein n=1 Tax=Escherichia coli TaxID=562 RepID=UPI00191A25D8|nr:hypothetical protein [Escherichia coli]